MGSIPENHTHDVNYKTNRSSCLSPEAIAALNTLNATAFEAGLRELSLSEAFSKLPDGQKSAAIEKFTAALTAEIAKIVESIKSELR